MVAGLLSKKSKKKKTKRGKGGKNEKFLNIFSANAAGLKNKLHSFKSAIEQTNAAIITIQESHMGKKGTIKIEGFEIFEAIRKKSKGGTLLAVHKALSPVLVKEYSEEFELLVVESKIGGKEIRIITGYGPQENWQKHLECPWRRGYLVNH